MPCYSPLNAFRTRDAETHKYGITFKSDCPDIVYEVKLPCGRCIGCRLEYARQWAVRCVHEASLHENNCFLTLTFDDNHLPKNGSLDKSVFQKFMKRLRKKYPKNVYGHIGYYMCGEYGEDFGRPHYHACLFNFDFPDKKLWKTTDNGDRLYTSEILNSLWQNQGYCLIGDVTFESASYVARYIMKKIKGSAALDYYQGLQPEYTTCSKKPAIGLEWIKKYYLDVYDGCDEVITRGKKSRPSRYYDKYYETHFPDNYDSIKIKREENLTKMILSSESTLDRVNVKHEIQLLKQTSITRPIEADASIENYYAQKSYDALCVEYNKAVLAQMEVL